MSRRNRRGGHEEEHENAERWLVTYADLITLLMVLFIVLFSISQVDQRKFDALRAGMAAGFGQTSAVLTGSPSVMLDPGNRAIQPFVAQGHGEGAEQADPQVQEAVERAVSTSAQQANERRYAEAAAEVARLADVERRLRAALQQHGLEADIRTAIDGRGLTVSLVSEHVVFQANLASLTQRGRAVVDALVPVLRDLPDPIEVDGHTNQMGTRPKYYATDWDLSAARAVAVLRRLAEGGGLPAERLSAAAFGQERPLIDPDVPGSQRLNKRVDIVVLSRLPDEAAELVDLVIRDRAEQAASQTSHEEGIQ